MLQPLELSGAFCYPNSNISSDIFYHDIYKKIDNLTVKKPIATCKVFGKNRSIYLASVENFFNDNDDYGTHFEGSIVVYLPQKQIEKLSTTGFDIDDININEILEVNINGIILNFYPRSWNY